MVSMSKNWRIKVAVQCTDTNYIPKVDRAGMILKDEDGQSYQIMHNGVKVYADSHYGAFNTEIIKILKGHHEPQEEKVFFEVLKAVPTNGIMLELGSFWAYYSMWFAHAVTGAKNYLIEPMALQHGHRNFLLNHMEGDFTEACVGGTSGEVDFEHWDGSLVRKNQVSVDDFIKVKGIDHLDLLHADIQGAELSMLHGAQSALAEGRIDFIFLSTHGEKLHNDCLELLVSNGYKVIAEHSEIESFSYDGLIVVCKDEINFPEVRISKKKYSPWAYFLFRLRRKFVR